MVLTVKETADTLGVKPMHVYYLIRMCVIDAFRVRRNWKIPVESLEEYCDKREIQGGIVGALSCDHGHAGCYGLSQNITTRSIQTIGRRSGNTVMERRGRELERAARRCHSVHRRKRQCIEEDDKKQLWLF